VPDWVAIVLLGIIEGLTEFIPVSSTGHLLLAERWLPHQSDLFNVVIQCGAVVAVIPLFRARCGSMLDSWRDREGRDYLLMLLLAFGITGVGGLVLDRLHFKLPEAATPVAIALVVGGLGFLLVERWLRGRALRDRMDWLTAAAVGCAQLVAAVFPGTSRSGATIVLALLLGVSRPAATEFSFLVGIPTLLAAGALKIFKQLHGGVAAEDWGMVALGAAVAAVVSFAAVKWFLRYVQTHTFTGFGWYRIGLGVLVLWLVR
jgi:undecaprenyl-diphosphatase